ncbi:MAG: quinol:electron acceptor oxidoreductase subunit ActD [Elusimicrobiota bacterium]
MNRQVVVVVGLFDTPEALLAAIPQAKSKGLGKLEAYTPYPIHGLDAALGLRRSPLGGMVFVMAVIGALTALAFQWWMSAIDYPVMTSGKAFFSWQAFVPIIFETMVLFSALTAGVGMLAVLNRLPDYGHPILKSAAITAITKDKFALSIAPDTDRFDADKTKDLLRHLGAKGIETLDLPDAPVPAPIQILTRLASATAAAMLIAGLGTYWGIKLFPTLPPMVRMQDQPRQNAQTLGTRLPVAGSVARGHLDTSPQKEDNAAILNNPLPATRENLLAGKRAYATYCQVCHGAVADGKTTLSDAYGAKPANLQTKQFRDYTDGRIYHIISKGKNSMPAYGGYMTQRERWESILYLRALQRAQNAKDTDLR